MAAGDLTDLATVKAWIPVTTTTDDALLTALVTQVSTFIQSWLNRTIAQQDYAETRNGQNMQQMMLRQYPIASVSSLVVDGIAIPPRPALGPGTSTGVGGYTFDDQAVYLTGWYRFTRGFQNVQVAYTAGYPSTPADIQEAANITVADWYLNARGSRIGIQTKSIESQSITYIKEQLPEVVQAILQQYRRVASIL